MPASDCCSTAFLPIVVAPTFNNAAALADVLKRIACLGLATIVVNDGSTDLTGILLESFPSIHVLAHSTNLGKAAAMRTGFDAAARLGFTHAVTIDTDGQHDPDDVPRLLEQARASPASLILGTRAHRIAGYPTLNRIGRWVSNKLVWLECGLRLEDTQCGLRLYPLSLISAAPCHASRYGFETEILTRAAWKGFAVAPIPVRCTYELKEGRVTHFQPWRDSIRAGSMHGKLLAEAAWRWPLRLAARFHPTAVWRDMHATPRGRMEFAGGLALGVFCACLPLYGIQAVLSFLGARALRLNRLSALAGSQLSSPPLSAVLIAASIALGHLLLNGHWPDSGAWKLAHASIRPWAIMRTFGTDWLTGSLVLGAVLSSITYLAARAALGVGRQDAICAAGVNDIGGTGQQLIESDGAKAAILQRADHVRQRGNRG